MDQQNDGIRRDRKFTGQAVNKIDGKGRTFLPARHRAQANARWTDEPQLILTALGFDKCLVLVDRREWFERKPDFSGLDWWDPDAIKIRRMSCYYERCEMDEHGRITIPAYLRELVGVKDDVLFVGAEDYIELWAPETGQEMMAGLINELPELLRRVREKMNPPAGGAGTAGGNG